MGVAKKILKSISIGAISAYFGATAVSAAVINLSDRVKTQEELEKIVEEERIKLNCDKPIQSILDKNFYGAVSGKLKNGGYGIRIGISKSRKGIIKHEVYHICDGHADEGYSFVRYWLFYEPQANLYGAFGLRL